jgi:hypothetical protein
MVERNQAEYGEASRRRERVLDNYVDGHIDRDDRDRQLEAINDELRRLELARHVVDVPRLDWGWDPRMINTVLWSIFEYIQLGQDLMPVSAEWLVPEWRADTITTA